MENNIEVLKFNDEQMEALTRGLTAVAEEATNAPKSSNEPLRAGDVIDLLSDTDDEDCEILGMMYKDTDEFVQDIQDTAQVVPFKMKVEIKEELTKNEVLETVSEQINHTEIDANNAESAEQYKIPRFTLAQKSVVISNEEIVSRCEQTSALNSTIIDEWEMHKENAMSSVPKNLNSIENHFEPAAILIGYDAPILNYAPTVTNVEIMPTSNDKDNNNTYTTLMDLREDDVKAKKVNVNRSQIIEDAETASEESEGGLYEQRDESNSAATFHTDQFECNNPEEEEEEEDTSTQDIIELGDSSSDEDMDEETEMKLIDLIESDEDQPEDGSIPSTSNESTKDSYDVLINYLCPECGLPCGSQKKWKAHTDTVHDFRLITNLNLHTIINKQGGLCYQCKDCFKKFNSKVVFSTVLKHRITHMPFPDYLKCRLCNMKFKARMSLRSHLIRKHYKICKHYMGQRNSFRGHIKFHCPVCNKVLTSYCKWQTHLEDEHEYATTVLDAVTKINDSVFECKECNSKFRQRQVMSHSLRHARYKPFHCKLCTDFQSWSIVGCTWHIRKIHLKVVNRGVQCQYCDKHFKTTATRNKHTLKKHGYNPLKCDVCSKEFSSTALLLSHMNFANHQKLK